MNGITISLVLITCLAVGLTFAGVRGYTIPAGICLALIITGALLVLAPTAFSFLLQLLGREPRFSEDERITCWILGGIMTMAGIIGSIFSRRPAGGAPK